MADQFFIGLDLGQSQDFTALAVIEKQSTKTGNHDPVTWAPEIEERWNLRHLERPALGTPYPEIVKLVREVVSRTRRLGPVELIVDATGVGAPVIDMLRAAHLETRAVIPVVITGGDHASIAENGRHHVPKKDLITSAAVLLQEKRLRIARELPLAEALIKELMNFRAKVSLKGNDTYAAWREGEHDDLVLAVALACWRCRPRRPRMQFLAGILQ
jgi:hypothetical protein